MGKSSSRLSIAMERVSKVASRSKTNRIDLIFLGFLRFSVQVLFILPAQLIHGVGHAIALFAVTGKQDYLSLEVLLESRLWSDLLKETWPTSAGPVIPAPTLTRMATRCVSLGGILANVSSIGVALSFLSSLNVDVDSGIVDLLVALWLTLFMGSSFFACLSLPDWQGALSGETPYWACGPAFAVRRGLGAAQERPPASDRLLGLTEILAREASTRGGQSGGFSVMTQRKGAPSIIFDKVVKGKRDDIVRILMGRLRSLLGKAVREQYRAPPSFEAVLLHLRYATGGATHWHNAQPHWFEHFESMVHHRVTGGQLEMRIGEVFNMIAHNGDMDGVYLEVTIDGQIVRHYFTQREARAFLTQAMPWTSSEGNSDSRSVAEWVDFHLTQGLTYKSLRYAWFTSALDFNRDIAKGRSSDGELFEWAEKLDQTMILIRKEFEHEGTVLNALNELPESARNALRRVLEETVGSHLAVDALDRFVHSFEQAFLNQDLAWVMRRASRDMVGEFALMVCTTLESCMGVFCLTQAFSLGYNQTLEEIFGSAEPMGVTSALQQGEADDASIQIYLKDGQYALIEFESNREDGPIRIFDQASPDDDLRAQPQVAVKASLPNVGEITTDSDWFPVNANPRIQRARPYSQVNAIQKDLSEIPYVLTRVRQSFEQGGENRATMARFSAVLFGNLLDPDREHLAHDLVLFGVDFNQDLLQEFALALKAILPGLRIRAENSGNVLKEMKRSKREGSGTYGRRTVFLGVSNSAQTQSTLAVVRKARELVGQERCFVLTQTFLNSMSEALGQSYHPEAPLLPNTFVNLSDYSPDGSTGRRRAEAATLVVAATQAVLTEILLQLTEGAIHAFEEVDPGILGRASNDFRLRSDLNETDIEAFRDFQTAIYEVEIPNRVGYNSAGEPIHSPDLATIDREAIDRAENQVEFVRAYAFFAAYIFIATVLGLPVFAVILSPMVFIPGVGILSHVLDTALFLTALWLIHLGIRKWQGRPLLERIGARAEVYIDRRYIARIIERYNATLFSNAPGFITPFFYWADTVQDALHRYGIRAHRGVVTIHRTPDERMGMEEANNAAEENMVYAQLGGIQFNGGEPQSRDKVRKGSRYEDASHPFQTVLSDSLSGLRAKYDGKLSPEVMRLINRRLIDLADGLVTEFQIGFYRKEIVNQSIWSVIRWIPGIQRIYEILIANDIDLKNLAGDADTANQAQIQSTKHPVSPMDIHGNTMNPRSTFSAMRTETQPEDKPFAVLAFTEDGLTIHLNQSAFFGSGRNLGREMRLRRGRRGESAPWVGGSSAEGIRLLGFIQRRGGRELFVIQAPEIDLELLLPIGELTEEQRHYIETGGQTSVMVEAA